MKKNDNKCKPVAVTHYPTKFNHFGLVFCHLPRYAYLNIVDLHPSEDKPMQTFFVLIPAFKDKQGKYMPPKLMVDDTTWRNTNSSDVDPAASSPHSLSSIDADQLKVASPSFETSSIPAVSPPAKTDSEISHFQILRPSNGLTQVKEAHTPVNQAEKVPSQIPLSKKIPVLTSRPNSQPLSIQGSAWPQTAIQNRQPWSEVSRTVDIDMREAAFPPFGKSSKSSPNKTVASSGRKQDDVSKMNRQFRTLRLTQLPADTLTPESDLSPVEA
jgi:hypothetical protein